MPHFSLKLLSISLLAASPGLAADAVRYHCGDGTKLVAKFDNDADGKGRATLTFSKPAGRMVLPQALSADGGRYTDAGTEFWIKGETATLARPGAAGTTCTVVR